MRSLVYLGHVRTIYIFKYGTVNGKAFRQTCKRDYYTIEFFEQKKQRHIFSEEINLWKHNCSAQDHLLKCYSEEIKQRRLIHLHFNLEYKRLVPQIPLPYKSFDDFLLCTFHLISSPE